MKKIFIIILFCNSLVNAQKSNLSSEDLYKKGVEFFNNNDMQNAKNAFEQSFELNPNFNSYAMYVIINLQPKSGDGDGLWMKNNKIVSFTLKLKESNKLKNGYFLNIVNDSYLGLEKQKLKSNRDDRLQYIESNINKNIDKKYIENPKDFISNLNKGLSLIRFFPRIDKYDNSYYIFPQGLGQDAYKAKQYFENLIKIRPKSETGYYFRGYINLITSNSKDAISDFNTALKLNSKNVMASYILGDLLKDNDLSGSMNNAIRMFEVKPNEVIESIKIDGSELDMLFFYALYYKEIVQLSHSDRKNENLLPRLMHEKKYSDLDILCNEIINQKKSNQREKEMALYYKGVANFNRGSFGKALEDFNSLIQINPSISDAYGMRGAVKTLSNDYEDAFLDLNKAIELEPNDGYMYFYRGIVNKKLGKTDESCSDYNKSRELGYENLKLIFFFENCK